MKRFTSFDGVKIRYRQWNSRADGVPVILQHGYIANIRVNWILPGIVFKLTRAGHRVIALDARGHGRSDKPRDAASYGESRMARDISCLIGELGLEQVDLVGYSLAFHFAPIPFARITNPTLILAGRHDPLAIHPEKLQAALGDAQLCITPGNHTTALLSPQFKSAMVEFLA